MFDKPLYGNNSRQAHEKYQGGAPRLPFLLISLPEAARLQSVRRERGEEDHTDPPGSFAAKARSARSGTIRTMSTMTTPLTPFSPVGNWNACFPPPPTGPARSLAACQSLHARQATVSIDTTQSCLPSSAILGNPPSTASCHYSSEERNDRTSGDSQSMLGIHTERLRGLSSSTRQGGAANGQPNAERFTRSEAELIESARDDILFHRGV